MVLMSVAEKGPDFSFLDQSLLKKKNIFFNEKDITVKDLGKSRFKLFITKGTYITKQDRGAIAANLAAKAYEINDIINKFETVQKKQLDLSPLEGEELSSKSIKTIKNHEKKTHQTANAAKVFANILNTYIPEDHKIKKEDGGVTTAKEEANRAEGTAVRLDAVLFLEKTGVEGVVKGALYELRSSGHFGKELTEGPIKDFMTFIHDEKREIKTDEDLKSAFKDFQKHIREGGGDLKKLKHYPTNQPLQAYLYLSDVNEKLPLKDKDLEKSEHESPIDSFEKIQNRINLRVELMAREPITPNQLAKYIKDPATRPFIEKVYKESNDVESFKFLSAALDYRGIKDRFVKATQPEEKEIREKQVTSKKDEFVSMILANKSRFMPSNNTLNYAKLDANISDIGGELLVSGAKNYDEKIKKMLLTGESI